MAFDQTTRNRLARFVSDIRSLLAEELTRQLQNDYGLDPNSGDVADLARLEHLDDARRETARLLRDTMVHYLAAADTGTSAKAKKARQDALDRIVREQAFTILNRLCALRMAEARGLLIESIAKGYQSKGFQLYQRLAGTALGETGACYRLFIFSVFDEFAVDLPVLFDRFSPQGRLFPRDAALLSVLQEINHPDIDPLWAEDETIGWLYQYYNSIEERKKMREESSAPRNSRELAVRNQFFTPRYVVEFLTDNTLGRLWYEMTQGQTRLKESCRYLVRRPNEISLKSGEPVPEPTNQVSLSQEELLKQPVYIPHRPLKDPREIRLLDPACGSMHFGLYAFDLFTVIYDEAWEIAHGTDDAAKSAETFALFVTFAASFADKAAFLREVPRLIVEHNIHGIDIDPRAAQIAGLSLWLRAQRTWHQAGLKPADRPRITRSNLVCAEPMPGEKELLHEFIEQLFPAGERPAFAFLLEKIFDRMTLAGEAGSLLRIEVEIRAAIAEARALAQSQSAPKQAQLFPGDERPAQAEFDLRGLNDEQFWQAGEQRIYDALEAYAEQAENGGGYKRRLFADDTAQGFAFIDLCRKHYDVVVMNPPFGEPSDRTLDYLEGQFPSWNKNLLCAFLSRAWNLLEPSGATAAIFDRTAIVKSTYEPFRRETLIPDSRLGLMADLGWGVLDANVEVTTCVLTKAQRDCKSIFFDVRTSNNEEKSVSLADAIAAENTANPSIIATHEFPSRFQRLPNAVIGYDFPEFLRRAFSTFNSLETVGFKANQGFALKADKHFRMWWEIGRAKSCVVNRMFNGSGYSPYVTALMDCAVSGVEPEDLPMDSSTRKSGLGAHRLPGVCFGKRGDYFAAHILPGGHIFTVEGQSIPVGDVSKALVLVGYLNTPLVRFALNKYCGQHKYSGYVNMLPFVELTAMATGAQAVLEVFQVSVSARRLDEIQSYFVALPRGHSIEAVAEVLRRTVASARACASDCEQLFQREIAARLNLNEAENRQIAQFAERQPQSEAAIEDIGSPETATTFAARSILSYALGSIFGRWDIRYATGERPAPELPDPFAPLPVCPPGMLQGDDGMPLSPEAGRQLRTEGCYPLDVAWDGILVDDPEHPLDLERRVHDALAVLWSDRSDALEHEVCALLGVPTLREWFRRPAGFFADHLKRYSKSRRCAPIYWPLSTPSGSYTIWLYYHRLTDQTLYICVNDFVDHKLKQVSDDATSLRGKSNRSSAEEKELERLSDLELELKDFRDELLRIARFWKPHLNDGVQITAAPLWNLFQRRQWKARLKETWEKLEAGDYDWAHLALFIWPDRVVRASHKDRSYAIAHDLEDVLWHEVEVEKVGRGGRVTTTIKWQPRDLSSADLQRIITEVKAR